MLQRKRSSNTAPTQSSQDKAPRRSDPLPAEEEEDDSLSQPTNTQVQRGLQSVAPSQLDQKVAEVVQYFLVKDQKKISIRRADIMKHVLKENRNIYPEIMNRVARTFEQVFGLKVIEIDTKNHVYILINKLEPAEEGAALTMNAGPKTGLLFIVLGLAFLKGGGVVKENVIWTTLKKLNMDSGEKSEVFGDVKKIITDEFVRQRYLEYVKVPHTEPPEYEFHWGQRAEIEVPKVKILEFMGQLFNQSPRSWTQQYREATTGNNTQAGTPASQSKQR